LGYYDSVWNSFSNSGNPELAVAKGIGEFASGRKPVKPEDGKYFLSREGKQLVKGLKGGVEGLYSIYRAGITETAAENRLFNPAYGRWSRSGIAMESVGNAIDPTGSFEIAQRTEPERELLSATEKLFSTQFEILEGFISKTASGLLVTTPLNGFQPDKSFTGALQFPATGLGTWRAWHYKGSPIGRQMEESRVFHSPLLTNPFATLLGMDDATRQANMDALGSNLLDYWEVNPSLGSRIVNQYDNDVVGRFGQDGDRGDVTGLSIGRVEDPIFGRWKREEGEK
jgi:hypothetical protein